MRSLRRTLPVCLALALFSCSPGADGPDLPLIDVDANSPDVAVADLGDGAASDLPAQTSRVVLELDEYLGEPAGSPVSRIYQLEGDAPFSGEVVTGRPGDWVIENDVARFLIEGEKRAMSPCPWGGTTVDAARLTDGDEDILGEICLMVNGGLSFRPDTFEVVRDGTSGTAAVLAASGALAVNDFLNLPAMIDDFVQGLGDRINVDIDEILPLRVTVYYVLRPGETGLQVLTAFRNDGDAQVDMLPIYLVASGGNGAYYNPLSSTRGFGSGSSSLGVGIDDLPFVVFNGKRASYAFVPETAENIEPESLPIAGSYLIVSGVAAALLGTPAFKLLPTLTAEKEALAQLEEVVHIQPGGVEVIDHRLIVGDGSISSVVDPAYEAMGLPTRTVSGTVVSDSGQRVAGAKVSALWRGYRTFNQAETDEDGRYRMDLPVGEYELRARFGAHAPTGDTAIVVSDDAVTDVELALKPAARIRVSVTTPDDGCDETLGSQPLPARLMVICPSGDCPDQPGMTEADVQFHRKPDNVAQIIYGGRDGVLEAEVPPGDYQLVVSRGIEWSVWPPDAHQTGGEAVSLDGGDFVQLDAEIARVIDSGSAYGGDFHIHSITSPDSPVPKRERVLNFAAEGVDVMVSTDHDFISDYAPTIEQLGLQPWVRSIIGEEVTTADLGHFNAFPVTVDETHPRGGAIDWGGGDSYTLLPTELYATINEYPGEQVIQVNHAAGLGLIKFAQADVLRGITYADREDHRLPPQTEPGKTEGDTGFWSDGFTAMELMNGNSRARFYRLGRWWMTMIGRGFTPTGTAVTDTHKLYGDLGGVPRTYVFGNEDYSCGDRPFWSLEDPAAFIANYSEQVNQGKAVGTNGPFLTVSVANGLGDSVGLGETIAADEQTTATIEIQMPEWMSINAIDVYLNPNPDDVITRPAEIIEEPIPPTETVAVAWDPDTDLHTVVTGETEHRVWRKSIEIPLQTGEDAFVVFVVKGGQGMWPVAPTSPFAFSNPIYLDADGNGYDNPPYAALAAVPAPPTEMPCADAFCGQRLPASDRRVTPQEAIDAIRHLDCSHAPGEQHEH